MDRPRRPGSDRRYPPLRFRKRKRSSSDSRSSKLNNKPGSDKWEDVCSICDDGGDFLCCEGRCLRSFHATEKHITEINQCTTLGLTEEQWKIFRQNNEKSEPLYICKNCKYNQHQCFSCGLLGSSDLSSGAEVFQCEDEKCGHFYHPKCLARLLYPDSSMQPLNFEEEVARGLKFLCPVHKCHVCKGGENKNDMENQFAVCRRCPTVYHRKCLPSDIVFEDDESNGIVQRAWDDVLRDQILIYCMKHEIDPELGTPARNHIIFPDCKNLLTRGPSKPKGQEDAPAVLDIPEEDMSPDHSSEPSQPPPQPAAETDQTDQDLSNGFNSFAPKALFPLPYPGSCGWLDD